MCYGWSGQREEWTTGGVVSGRSGQRKEWTTGGADIRVEWTAGGVDNGWSEEEREKTTGVRTTAGGHQELWTKVTY